MHTTPASQDVPSYWQVHAWAMQAKVFMSQRRTPDVDVGKLCLLCAGTASV